MTNSSNQTLNKQKRLLILFGGIFFIGVAAICYFTIISEDAPASIIQETTLPLDKISPQELWMTRVEAEKKTSDEKLNFLEDLVLDSRKQNEKTALENEQLKRDLAKYKDELALVANEASKPRRSPENEISIREPFSSFIPSSAINVAPRAPLTEIISEDFEEKLLDVERVIPAGTSVKAILVSSVDMPCGVYNTSDPQPVKLRILDDGHLPKSVTAKLKGGIIIGSANADLSNERIYIRLERLTQVRRDGKFIETVVTGYVTGEDGKYGLKGIVVDKSYKMVENAAISGFFGGLNQYLQASVSRGVNIYDPGYNINGRDMAVQGGCQGANGAFDMLADYYIRRAEQIRPVIQASAGRRVDITFTCNAELGDLHTVEKVKRIRECNRGDS